MTATVIPIRRPRGTTWVANEDDILRLILGILRKQVPGDQARAAILLAALSSVCRGRP